MVRVAFHGLVWSGLSACYALTSGILGLYTTRRRKLYGSDRKLFSIDTPLERRDTGATTMHVFSFLSDPTPLVRLVFVARDVHTINIFEPAVHPQVSVYTSSSPRLLDSVCEDHSPLRGTLCLSMIISLLFRSRYV